MICTCPKQTSKKTTKGYLSEFIGSIKLIDKYVPSSFDNFSFGSYFYVRENLDRAIEYYEKALEQEKVQDSVGRYGCGQTVLSPKN